MKHSGGKSRVKWLIILTFPNGGSTALAKLLLTAKRTVCLNAKAEGQWLVPEMCTSRARWDPDLVLDYRSVRRLWMKTVRRKVSRAAPGGPPWLVIEKSPPNACRYRELVAMLKGMKTHIAIMTRDPFATCASWSRRYPRATLAREWGWPDDQPPADEDAYFRALAQIWIARAKRLRAACDDAICRIRYEDFADDPAATIQTLANRIPRLATADATATVRIKDYPPATIHNTNEATLEILTDRQREQIASVLVEHSALVTELGYPVAL